MEMQRKRRREKYFSGAERFQAGRLSILRQKRARFVSGAFSAGRI